MFIIASLSPFQSAIWHVITEELSIQETAHVTVWVALVGLPVEVSYAVHCMHGVQKLIDIVIIYTYSPSNRNCRIA